MLLLSLVALIGAALPLGECVSCSNCQNSNTFDAYRQCILTEPENTCETTANRCILSIILQRDTCNIQSISGACTTECDFNVLGGVFDTYKYCCDHADICNRVANLNGHKEFSSFFDTFVGLVQFHRDLECQLNSENSQDQLEDLIEQLDTVRDELTAEKDTATNPDPDILVDFALCGIAKMLAADNLLTCIICEDETDESQCTDTEVCRLGEVCGQRVCESCSSSSSEEDPIRYFTKGCSPKAVCSDGEEEANGMEELTFCCEENECNALLATEEENPDRRKRSNYGKRKRGRNGNRRSRGHGRKYGNGRNSGHHSGHQSSSSSNEAKCPLVLGPEETSTARCDFFTDLYNTLTADGLTALTEAYNKAHNDPASDPTAINDFCDIVNGALDDVNTHASLTDTESWGEIFTTWKQLICPSP